MMNDEFLQFIIHHSSLLIGTMLENFVALRARLLA
jgi:hypothetical protein